MKRLIDVVVSAAALFVSAPLILPVMFLVWRQDGHSPLYVAERVGKGGRLFKMVKLRSMIKHADQTGVDSTGSGDPRITPIGAFIRRYKMDELTQLWNVLRGEMSLVGPRPNVKRETDLYTAVERDLLTVAPGITDFSSIVFADEGDILAGRPDPDLAYNQLIRPGKSQLGLFYVSNRSVLIDCWICAVTVVALISRPAALRAVQHRLRSLGAPDNLVELAGREFALVPMAPPGAVDVVSTRSI